MNQEIVNLILGLASMALKYQASIVDILDASADGEVSPEYVLEVLAELEFHKAQWEESLPKPPPV